MQTESFHGWMQREGEKEDEVGRRKRWGEGGGGEEEEVGEKKKEVGRRRRFRK